MVVFVMENTYRNLIKTAVRNLENMDDDPSYKRFAVSHIATITEAKRKKIERDIKEAQMV